LRGMCFMKDMDDRQYARAVYEASQGWTEDGFPKVGIYMSVVEVDPRGDATLLAEITLAKTAVFSWAMGDFSEFDFAYKSFREAESRDAERILELYRQKLAEEAMDPDNMNSVVLTAIIVPVSFDGSGYMVFRNPVLWANQTMKNGKPDSVLKILVPGELASIDHAEDALNTSEIHAEVERARAAREDEERREALMAEEDQKREMSERLLKEGDAKKKTHHPGVFREDGSSIDEDEDMTDGDDLPFGVHTH